jgi:hypothetical protein
MATDNKRERGCGPEVGDVRGLKRLVRVVEENAVAHVTTQQCNGDCERMREEW